MKSPLVLILAGVAILSGPAAYKATAGPSCDAVIRRCIKEIGALTEAADRLRGHNPEAAARMDELVAKKILDCQNDLVQACPYN
jgi:hypothetical protein